MSKQKVEKPPEPTALEKVRALQAKYAEPAPDPKALQHERPHHRVSPSSLQGREACPCYDSRQPKKQHERTIEGSKQHNVLENRADDLSLSDERMEHATMAAAVVDKMRTLLNSRGNTVIQELDEVYMPVWNREDISSGYNDKAMLVKLADGRIVAHLFDYKFGAWEVEPVENNLQIWAYSCGLLEKFPEVQEVHAYIIQPEHDMVDYTMFPRERYPEMLLRIKRVVARYDDPNKKPRATTGCCLFCANIAGCPEAERLVRAISQKYPPLKAFTDVMRFNPTTIGMNSASDNAVIMDVAAIVETWAGAVRSKITEHAIETGTVPPSFRLQGQERRSIVNAEAAETLARTRGVPAEIIQKAKTISIEPLTDYLRDQAERGMKDAAEEDFKRGLTSVGAYGDAYPVIMLVKERKKTNKNKDQATE